MPTDRMPVSLALTPEDVRRLLHDATAATRVEMTDRIAGAYGNSQLSDQETLVAEQIFRLLLRDTELRVRVALSQHIKNSSHIPRDIVVSLARDVEEVSLPVLQFSEVLTDADLMELLRNTQEISRYLAVSKRLQLSEAVSETLLEKNNDQVVALLVDNKGARISDSGYQKIVAAHAGNKAIMQAIGLHPRLPAAAAEKLVHIVSSSLAVTLKAKYNLTTEHIEKEVEKTRESETLSLIRHAQSQADIDKLIAQMAGFDRLTPSIILSALCQGNFAFFETSLARLSNIPVANARALITDKGDLGFRAVYNKSGLPDAMFPAVRLLLHVVHELDGADEKPGTPRYANSIVERILQYAEEAPVENLSYIIALVRRVVQ
ncbi:MAG: DUF2336 domain-containing protein [Pseudomonadota bacterium]|nr:DUF2336 domain-containing protein [Pseudomonadota bacterium]MDE3037442.1 DUF2336 domain-containing protein [Pseudomonadota bacterium]